MYIINKMKSLREELLDWGFRINTHSRIANSIDDMIEYHQRLLARLDSLPYEIDGVVYKVDRIDWQDRLGQVSRAP